MTIKHNPVVKIMLMVLGVLAIVTGVLNFKLSYDLALAEGGRIMQILHNLLPTILMTVFWALFALASFRKWFAFFWLSPILLVYMFYTQGAFLITVLTSNRYTTMPSMIVLAVLSCVVPILATIVLSIWLRYKKLQSKNTIN